MHRSCDHYFATTGRDEPADLIGGSVNQVPGPSSDDCSWLLDDEDGFSTETDQQWESARFLLRATERHSLTHDGVDDLSESVQSFVDNICSQIADKIESGLPPDTDSELRKKILEACSPIDLFTGLKTRYMREKFYATQFNYVVQKLCYAQLLPDKSA